MRFIQCIGHGGLHEAGRHHIHRNTARRHFLRQRFRHANQACLGGGVIRLAGIAGDANDGRDGNNPPLALFHHAAQSGARQAKRRGQIHFQHRIPIRITHTQRQHIPREAGIIHQNIQAARFGFDFFNQLRRRFRICKISRCHNDA